MQMDPIPRCCSMGIDYGIVQVPHKLSKGSDNKTPGVQKLCLREREFHALSITEE